MACKVIVTLFLLVSPSFAYYTFRSKIPNGEIVPHPCKANYMWQGVGHMNPNGGGDRNPFGRDFDEAGKMWTQELCRYDSDGDGKTNGQELGDPNCEWTEGTVPESVTGISHPGVCEPYGQGICAGKDTYVDCSIESFGDSCDVIKRPEVVSMDLRFHEHTIPDTETNYYCQYFDLPSAQDLHIVANEGLIDNRNVLHHMILYGCSDKYVSSPTDDFPNACSMGDGDESCTTIISLWTVGLPGTCFGEDIGYRIGSNGYKKVKLEIHYNNPMLVADYTDKTGMRIYYRPALPQVEDLATFTVGQNRLEIPPGMPRVTINGSCTSDCTRQIMTKQMYVVSTSNHMHYMGVAQRTEIRRNGQVIKVLADDQRYSYDSPVQHNLETPFEVLPGDEIATSCTYSSLSKKRTIFFGEGTSDEMCFAFLTVYPADALPLTQWCTSFGPLSLCDHYSRTPKMGCDWARFSNMSDPEMQMHYSNLKHNCNMDGRCRRECKELVDGMMEHPCLQKEMKQVVVEHMQRYKEGAKFLAMLFSCSGHSDDDDMKDDDHKMDCWKDCGDVCQGGWDGPVADAASLPIAKMAAILMTAIVALVL